ncbi:hypothetical protein LXL04_021418 [Taraxacum kok-saghyz]
MTKLKSSLLLLVVLVVASMEFHGSAAKQFVVGDSFGWAVPRKHSFYVNWSRHHSFKTNNVLIFNFTDNVHNVVEVTEEAYHNCDGTKPISLQTISPARFTIRNTDNHFYICSIGLHCKLGQKLRIKVSAMDDNSYTMLPH